MPANRKYTTEFKIAAVRRWEEVGNFNEVGRELGVSSSLIRSWNNLFQEDAERAFPGKGHVKDEDPDQMRPENARLKEENTILKKAVGSRFPIGESLPALDEVSVHTEPERTAFGVHVVSGTARGQERFLCLERAWEEPARR